MTKVVLAFTGCFLGIFLEGAPEPLADFQPYTSPQMMKKLALFRNKVGEVFLLLQSLGPHPGG